MREKKKSLFIGMLLIIIILILMGCAYLTLKNNDSTELVSSIYYKELFDEEIGEKYTYNVPKVNLDFDNVNKINNEIYNKYVTMCTEMEKNKQEGLSITDIGIDYKYYINSDVLSLVIKSQSSAAGAEGFNTYNINIKTGEIVTNEEIIKEKGITSEQFLKELKSIYKKACETYNKLDPNSQDYQSMLETYNTWVLKYTLSEENCNVNVPIFLGENGNIYVIAYIGSVTGASGYEYVLQLGI